MPLRSMRAPDELYSKTKVAVLHLIQQKMQEGSDRLPPGEEMAKTYGVSLVLIRDVLGELESRGYITRRRGKGILINAHVCRLGPRIDEQMDFAELIRLQGLEPSVRLISDTWADAAEAEGLPQKSEIRDCGEPLLCLERVFYGGSQPLIYSRGYYRKSNFQFDYRKWKGFEALTLNEFLEIFCFQQANTTLAELDLETVSGRVAELLGMPEGTTLFRMGDIRYALDGQEILSGYVLFHHSLLPLQLFRQSQ